MDDVGHRFAAFYARRTAQNLGELVAGYFNHEDPRSRFSSQNGFWGRVRSAVLTVVVVDGSDRLALAPIAGAFGSGFTGMACYRTRNSLGDGFSRTGLAYGGYFGRALAHEFHPDIQSFAHRVIRKKKQD